MLKPKTVHLLRGEKRVVISEARVDDSGKEPRVIPAQVVTTDLMYCGAMKSQNPFLRVFPVCQIKLPELPPCEECIKMKRVLTTVVPKQPRVYRERPQWQDRPARRQRNEFEKE